MGGGQNIRIYSSGEMDIYIIAYALLGLYIFCSLDQKQTKGLIKASTQEFKYFTVFQSFMKLMKNIRFYSSGEMDIYYWACIPCIQDLSGH